MNARGTEHERWRDEVAAYAIGSLDPAEAAAVEQHLAECESCRDELRWLVPAVAVLPASVPQLEPPRRLRRRTLAAARADLREPDEPRRRPWALPALAAVAAVAAVALAIAVGAFDRETSIEARTVAVEVLGEPAAGATGTLVTDGERATLEVENMPPLDADHVYETWVQRGDQILPSTTFIVDRDGSGAATIPDVAGAERVMVTREPRGGSLAPTTEPLLQAVVTAT
jgi:anti-sigma-K factor RskA